MTASGKIVICVLTLLVILSWRTKPSEERNTFTIDSLRQRYERPVSQWPKPNVDPSVVYNELGALPKDSSSIKLERDPKVKLGQLLFFDPRLSGSNQISCSSCHNPDMGWGDGRRVSVGNAHLEGKRNSPSLLNVGAQSSFFWDGRSLSLEDQVINPLATHHEMNMDVPLLAAKLSKITSYKPLFEKAYGESHITIDRITEALAAFESTIVSNPSRFDEFVNGKYNALTDQELRGLDLFRGKARCMNCHHGVYFRDDSFHNIGFTEYGGAYQDLGRYEATRNPVDVGKFKTPSLRDVINTNPWMHNGLQDNMKDIIDLHNTGMHQTDSEKRSKADPLYPKTDVLMQPLRLTSAEREDLIAFLHSITAAPSKMSRPELPK